MSEKLTLGLQPQTEAELAATRQAVAEGRKNIVEGVNAPEFAVKQKEKVNPTIVIDRLTGKPYRVEVE